MGFPRQWIISYWIHDPKKPTIKIQSNNGDDDDDDNTMQVRQSWAKNENL